MTIGVLPVRKTDVDTLPPVTVTIDGGSLGIAGVDTLYTAAYPTPNAQLTFAIPDGTKGYEVRAKSGGAFRIAFAGGIVATGGFDVPAGTAYSKQQLNTVGLTLYLASANAPETFQIILST